MSQKSFMYFFDTCFYPVSQKALKFFFEFPHTAGSQIFCSSLMFLELWVLISRYLRDTPTDLPDSHLDLLPMNVFICNLQAYFLSVFYISVNATIIHQLSVINITSSLILLIFSFYLNLDFSSLLNMSWVSFFSVRITTDLVHLVSKHSSSLAYKIAIKWSHYLQSHFLLDYLIQFCQNYF